MQGRWHVKISNTDCKTLPRVREALETKLLDISGSVCEGQSSYDKSPPFLAHLRAWQGSEHYCNT